MAKFKQLLLFLLHAIMCPIGALVLRGKRRCGFLDLGKDVEVVGEVVGVDPGGGDGDVCFDVLPIPAHAWLTFYKGRQTVHSTPGVLHCEFMPCQQLGALKGTLDAALARAQAGEKLNVRVKGRWSFDGVHTDAFDGDGLTFKEVWACLMGHGANEAHGWAEIHPATSIEILN